MIMKTTNKLLPCLLIALFAGTGMNAQFFKKLAKKAEKAAERTIEGRVEKESAKKTDKTLDDILEPGSGKKQAPSTTQGPRAPEGSQGQGEASMAKGQVDAGPKTLNVYSKFDFVPGDTPLYQDDFSQEFIGDLPSNWNTNGSGEVVQLEDGNNKWYAISNSSLTLPDLGVDLPMDYTIEFDLLVTNISKATNTWARLEIFLSETPGLTQHGNNAQAHLYFSQNIDMGVRVHNQFSGDPDPISNSVTRDLNMLYTDVVHVAIAVNGNRYRLWLNEHKVYDLPQLIVKPELIKTLKFEALGMDNEKDGERLLITNLRINQGGEDLRRKLISEGKISTNGILFGSGSADLLPESMGIIRQISQVLSQEGATKLKIIGHTDSDGPESSNLILSQERAEAVKTALTSIYGIAPERLETEGKGESVPLQDNGTALGKAQNRRVEFIKI